MSIFSVRHIALRAAREAGRVLLRCFDRPHELRAREKSPNDWVSDADRQSEAIIRKIVSEYYPRHPILGEEGGLTEGEDREVLWIIDPLDGTHNFLHGYPHFCVSIAIQFKGQLWEAVIYDPIRNELFYARRGGGAYCNDRRMRVSEQRDLNAAFLSTGLSAYAQQSEGGVQKHFETMMPVYQHVLGLRRSGSAALDLAYVAAGRLDAYWEWGPQIWDWAAGVLLVEESGGLVNDFSGQHDYFEKRELIAATPKLMLPLVDLMARRV